MRDSWTARYRPARLFALSLTLLAVLLIGSTAATPPAYAVTDWRNANLVLHDAQLALRAIPSGTPVVFGPDSGIAVLIVSVTNYGTASSAPCDILLYVDGRVASRQRLESVGFAANPRPFGQFPTVTVWLPISAKLWDRLHDRVTRQASAILLEPVVPGEGPDGNLNGNKIPVPPPRMPAPPE